MAALRREWKVVDVTKLNQVIFRGELRATFGVIHLRSV